MATFPARGQKAPDYWDVELKGYIDEGDAAPIPTSSVTGFLEAVEDAVAGMVVEGANISVAYADNGASHGTLTISAVGVDAEAVRDTIGTALVGTPTDGVTVTVNDGGDTITLSIAALAMSKITGLVAALADITSDISDLTATVAGKMDGGLAGLPIQVALAVYKNEGAGTWPASRPDARPLWLVGTDPGPAWQAAGDIRFKAGV